MAAVMRVELKRGVARIEELKTRLRGKIRLVEFASCRHREAL